MAADNAETHADIHRRIHTHILREIQKDTLSPLSALNSILR